MWGWWWRMWWVCAAGRWRRPWWKRAWWVGAGVAGALLSVVAYRLINCLASTPPALLAHSSFASLLGAEAVADLEDARPPRRLPMPAGAQ